MKAPVGTILLLLGCGLALSSPSRAQVITTFSSLGAFNAALGPVPITVEDFGPTSHFPITTGVLNSTTNLPGIGIFPGMIQPGVTYSTTILPGLFFNIDAGGGFTGGFLDTAIVGAGPLTMTFAGPVQAFGFDTNSLILSAFTVTINFTSGTPYSNTFAVPGSAPTFFGFESNAANITSVVIGGGSGNHSWAIDNFRFTSVPEPGVTWLIGGGLVALACLRRRRR